MHAFVVALCERKLQSEGIFQKDLAPVLGVGHGRVSQLLRSPRKYSGISPDMRRRLADLEFGGDLAALTAAARAFARKNPERLAALPPSADDPAAKTPDWEPRVDAALLAAIKEEPDQAEELVRGAKILRQLLSDREAPSEILVAHMRLLGAAAVIEKNGAHAPATARVWSTALDSAARALARAERASGQSSEK